ncbi:hypothetical protein ACLB2K_004541 [Fragaria x ananassa]
MPPAPRYQVQDQRILPRPAPPRQPFPARDLRTKQNKHWKSWKVPERRSNGVRIKTWPNSPSAGNASDIHFENINMDNVGTPILIDQEYCPWNLCNKQAPSKVKISNVSFKNIKGTSSTPVAVKIACAKGLPCEKVETTDIDLKYSGNEGSITSQCSNVKPTGTRVANTLACATYQALIEECLIGFG